MDTFIVAVPTDAVQFNEVHRNRIGTAGYFVANNIFSKLVVHGSKSRAVFGDLARDWEVLDGARRFRFHLQPEARWHDGTPLRAHDVAYTHRHAIANGYHGASFLRGVDDVVALGDHIVEHHLAEPNAGFFTQLGNFIFTHVLPAHRYEGTDWDTNPHNRDPLGSGPFRLATWDPGERIVLEAVADHWGPPPGVDRIELLVVPDPDEAAQMVLEGRAHYVVQDVVNRARRTAIADTEHAVVHRERGPGITGLGFNHRRTPWQDRRARAAVAHALDRSRLEHLALPGGVAGPYDRYLPETIDWAYADDVTAPPFDPGTAARLLDEAGVVSDRGGRRMDLDLVHLAGFAGHDEVAAVVASCLDDVGITCRVTALDVEAWSQRALHDSDFDLVMLGGNIEPDPEIAASRFETGGGRNLGHLSIPDADAAFAAGRAAVDLRERGTHYRRLQDVWARETAWIPLFRGAMSALRSRAFFGWSDQLDASIGYWHWGRIRPVTTEAAPIHSTTTHPPSEDR